MKFGTLIATSGFVALVSCVHAQTLANGNFTTDLSGWAHNTDTQWLGDGGPDGHPGVAWLNNSTPTSTGFISQTITGLTVGGEYSITGYYESYGGFNGSHSLTAQIDSVTEFSNTDTGYVLNWKPFTFDFIAAGPTAALQVNSQVGSDTNYLVDQISISQVTPEPGTDTVFVSLVVAATAIPMQACRRRLWRKKQ